MTDDTCTAADEQDEARSSGDSAEEIRARAILGVPKLWIFPLAIPAVMIALVATIYIGSVVNPTGHLHDLPVRIVDQDAGATTPAGHVDLGESLVQALLGNKEVTSYLDLQVVSLANADLQMDDGDAYATLVIPSTFTASALLDAGNPSGTGTPPEATVQLLENSRLGSLGVNLAAGVVTPALSQISKQLGPSSLRRAQVQFAPIRYWPAISPTPSS